MSPNTKKMPDLKKYDPPMRIRFKKSDENKGGDLSREKNGRKKITDRELN